VLDRRPRLSERVLSDDPAVTNGEEVAAEDIDAFAIARYLPPRRSLRKVEELASPS
jgi:hypothetical protein